MKILSGNDLREALYNIIDGAEKNLFIISPYIKLTKEDSKWVKIINKLKEKCRTINNVEFYTRSEYYESGENIPISKKEFCNKFEGLREENIFFFNYLHTKMYLNDSKILVTSLNLLDHSIDNNIEIGCLIDDPNEYKKTKEDLEEQFNKECFSQLYERMNDEIKLVNLNTDKGFDNIKYDPSKIIITNYDKRNNTEKTGFIIEIFFHIDSNENNVSLEYNLNIPDENYYQKFVTEIDVSSSDAKCPIKNFKKDSVKRIITFESEKVNRIEMAALVFNSKNVKDVSYRIEVRKLYFKPIDYVTKILRAIIY